MKNLLVGVAGFEPTTFRSQSGRATKLRHTPSVRHVGYMAVDGTAAGYPRARAANQGAHGAPAGAHGAADGRRHRRERGGVCGGPG